MKHKELLHQLRQQVDVLTLSATPIPRTLHMSLAGLRDISVIETPPEDRRPVRTYVGDYDEELVKRAIERELEREGQVFFVHNRVETIDETASASARWCPRRASPWPTGRWTSGELEKVMLDFLRGDADVLVCTTIIESGLDIPQREHADRGARRRARPGPALPAPRARRALARARLRLPALSLAGGAHRGRRGAAVDALGLHRARLRLQDRDARPRDPRRRQPARRRAVGPRGRGGLRALHGDARRGGAAAGRRFRRGGRRARAHGPPRGRLRARGLRALRGGEDRAAPAGRGCRARSPT